MKHVSVIILNLNGKEYTKNCLNSIKKNTSYKNYNVILVDNGSTDGSQKLIKSKFKWVNLIENKSNKGFSGGNNIGIKYAIKKYNSDYYYPLNNDTIVKEGWLTEAVKTAEKDKSIGIVGSKQFTFENKPAISAGWINPFGVKYYYGKEEREVNWVSGAGFLITKFAINKVGLLDEMYNPIYYEESDWEKRVKSNKMKIVFSPKSVFLHKGGEDSKGVKKINFNLIFYKNRARFFSKYDFLGFVVRFITDLYRSRIKIKTTKLMGAYWKGFVSRNEVKIEFPIVN